MPNGRKRPNVAHAQKPVRGASSRKQDLMTSRPSIAFAKLAAPKKGSVFVLAADGG
ncbi:MAG: leucyl aminopeptidase, partial [Mesorhizobium sp.]